MLEITVPATELFNEKTQEFMYTKEQTLQLEHSLISLSKWESKWHKAFLGKQEKTNEETLDYVRCMTITKNVDPNAYLVLTPDNVNAINAYIDNPMTATRFNSMLNQSTAPNRDVITAELIYYWMVAFNIPFECEKWHLNRLLTLIRVCELKNSPPKKMSKSAIMRNNAALNNARRNKLHTRG